MQAILKILLTITTLTLLLAIYLHPITAITQDLGRHIKTGEIITKTMHIPKTNLYSYTYPDFPFINHHWGSEVIFFILNQAAGFTGILILTTLASIIAFVLLYVYAFKHGNILSVSFVSLLSLGMLFERTDVRPESFSYLLFAVFLLILFKNRAQPTRWIYTLIPLELLWINLHVYFITGIVLIGLFLLDKVITSYRHSKYSSLFTFNTLPLKLFFVLIACCLTTLLNPNGLSGALYPFHVFANYGYSIEENQNIFFLWELFQKRTIVFFWISVFTLFTVLLVRIKYTRPIDWLITITFIILGAQAIRNIPLYVFAVFIPFTYHLSYIISTKSHSKSLRFTIYAFSLLIISLWQLHYVLTTKPIGITTPIGASKAVDFLQSHHLKGPIFNNFDIGSYLIFRLYPGEKVFVDGRPEAYPASFFQQVYIPMQQDPRLFAKMDKKYHFHTIFFSHTDQTPWAKQFLQDITKNPVWHIVYLDDTVIILIKTTTKSPITPIDITKYEPSANSIQGYYQLLLFFQTIRDEQAMQKIAQKILEKDPNDCAALSLLSQTQTGIIYWSRYQSLCQ